MNSNINIKQSPDKHKLDKSLSKLVNWGVVIAFFGLAIIIYWYFFSGKKITQFECFENSNTSIYESALNNIFINAPRLTCNILASPNNNICIINGESHVKYNFPVHMIKLIDGSILAVFNDGRLYKKDTIQNTMWQGPINNSLPNDSIPLRMITLAPNLTTLLGVGYDNMLYSKQPNEKDEMDITVPWKQVPNNSNIIYVIFDRESGNMISIDTQGKLQIKTSTDYTSDNTELITRLDRPILRLYYDNNGYMLAIDTNFDMYQFKELNWKNSPLNLARGANSSKIQDVLYDNDGRMYGLVFNTQSYILQIMKQDMAYYLGRFISLDQLTTNNASNPVEFALSDQDILKCKVGNIETYTKAQLLTDNSDDDVNFAYQKMIMQTRADLKEFCSNRNSIGKTNIDNYDLLSQVDSNTDRIANLKNIISNLIIYEPDKARIIEKYPIITQD
jgi:hypothetical protein